VKRQCLRTWHVPHVLELPRYSYLLVLLRSDFERDAHGVDVTRGHLKN